MVDDARGDGNRVFHCGVKSPHLVLIRVQVQQQQSLQSHSRLEFAHLQAAGCRASFPID